MKQLFTNEELESAKSKDLLPLECLVCGKTFFETKHYIKSHIINPHSPATGNCCSQKCANVKQIKNKIINKNCPKCGNEFIAITGKDEKSYCSSKCAHSRPQSLETRKKQSISAKNSEKVKLANLNHATIKRDLICKTCPMCKKEFKVRPSEYKRIYCSKDCYNKDSKADFRKCGKGGCREGSGRSKSGWYKGYYCGSSYELAWIIYNIDHKIDFKRNIEGFEYTFEGVLHKYYPDFIKEGVYYEIKGFKRKNDDAKFKYFPHKLKVLFKKDLKEIFEYVKNTYGNNFIELYEGNPYNEKKNKCIICGNPAKNKFCSRKCTGNGVGNKLSRRADSNCHY